MPTPLQQVPIHLVPAFGRDYKNSAAVLMDWQGGKDFRISDISSPYNGGYTSIRDWSRADRLMIRYNHLRSFVITCGMGPSRSRSTARSTLKSPPFKSPQSKEPQ